MQEKTVLYHMIREGRPDVDKETIETWVYYLSQLKGCSLQSVTAQGLNQDEWLLAREKGIGGSEIAAVMGKNPWNSARQIWFSKTGQFNENANKPQSESARWGNVLESTIAEEWAKRENRQYINIPVILRSDEFSYMFANIDGFTLSEDRLQVEGILEIKTTSVYRKDVWEVGPIPEYYICQANWYCMITGLPMYDIVCLVGGQSLYSYTLPTDRELVAEMKAAADHFWNINVLQMVEPEAQAADIDLLKEVTSEEEKAVILQDDESERLAEAYVGIREKIKQLTEVKEAIYAQLYSAIGGATSAVTQTHTLQVVKNSKRTCDLLKLQQEFPTAYNECVSTTSSISLRVK